MDVAALADLLQEIAEHHDPYEKTASPHDWWDWYAAYISAREHGSNPAEALCPPGSTWRRSDMFFPDAFAGLAALSERVNRWVRLWVHRRR